jgi:chitinase
MKRTPLLKRALWSLLLLLASSPAFAQFKVIGYLPSWNGEVSAVQFSKLTHINYAFLLPNADGSLKAIENPAKLQSLVSTAHTNNVKVLISVGGWLDGNPGVFVSIGNNAGYTSAFTTNLINFISQYNLDGVDIDWEHPDANSQNGYASVMQSLATQLHSRGKLLTTAVAGGTWAGPYIQASVLSNVDFLNIMAYDDTAPAHSTYALASQSVSYWRGRGLPAAKTVLGVPFYGQPNGVPFATLLAQGADPNADLFNGVGYNGIPTIKSKTNLAFDQGGGIMIWHLGQDAVGANSLLTAINQVVLSRGGTTPPPTTAAQAVPGTLQAESYTAMSGIQTETTTDTGGGQNVGYIDAGDWLDYAVNVSTAGSYTLSFRVASLSGGGQVQLRNAAGTSLGSVTVGATGGWQTWTTLTTTVTLPAGAQTLRVYAVAGGFNLNYLTFATGSTPPPANTPPTVSLTSPANGATATAPATITISANAADANGTVSSVAFYNGATLLGTDTSAPYSYSWTGVAAGTYSITAKATDNAGAVTTSSAVSVTVTSGGGGTTCSAPAWVAATAYSGGAQVSYQGNLYTAKWWSQGEDPATHSCTDCSWKLVGPCTATRGALASASATGADSQLSVYPNPVRQGQRLSVQLGASYARVQLTLTDLSGRTLITAVYQNASLVELELPASLPKGLLLLQIRAGKDSFTRKISNN